MARTNVPVLALPQLDLANVDVALHVTDGAMFTNNGETYVWVNNAGAGAHVVTFVTTRTIGSGQLAVADEPHTFAAGKSGVVGPFDPTDFNVRTGADTGKVYVNADGTQSEVLIVPFKKA
jgi:hypothetical protein